MYHSSVDDDYCVAVYLFYVAMQVPIVRDQVESKSTHKSWKKWRQDPSWLQTFFYFAHGQFLKRRLLANNFAQKSSFCAAANAFKSWSEFVMTVDAAKFKGKSRVENWLFFHFCPLYKNSINRQTSWRGGQHRAHLWVWLVKRGK